MWVGSKYNLNYHIQPRCHLHLCLRTVNKSPSGQSAGTMQPCQHQVTMCIKVGGGLRGAHISGFITLSASLRSWRGGVCGGGGEDGGVVANLSIQL